MSTTFPGLQFKGKHENNRRLFGGFPLKIDYINRYSKIRITNNNN